jgi:hypothetical protein
MQKKKNSEIEQIALKKLTELLKNCGDFPKLIKNSGSARSEPDIISPYGIFESKGTENNNFTITDEILDKFRSRAAIHPGLGAIFINTSKHSYFVLDPIVFALLWKLYISGVQDAEIDEAERVFIRSQDGRKD